jgi:hypothetical protein
MRDLSSPVGEVYAEHTDGELHPPSHGVFTLTQQLLFLDLARCQHLADRKQR